MGSFFPALFFSGLVRNSSSQVRAEAGEFGDILLDPFQDSYNNLTLKTLYMIRHFKMGVNPSFSYFLKTDDDSFIFVGKL